MMNSIKRFILLMMLAVMSMPSFATEQIEDMIYWNGEMHEMSHAPLFSSLMKDQKVKNFINHITDNKGRCSALWRGCVAYWSVKDNSLCLDSIRVPNFSVDEDYFWAQMQDFWFACYTYYPEELSIFAPYMKNGHIVASWETTKNTIHSGKWIGDGFYEHDDVLEIRKGVVKSVTSYDNRVIFEGGMDDERRAFAKELHERMNQLFNLNINSSIYIFDINYTGADIEHPIGVDFEIHDKTKKQLGAEAYAYFKKEVARFILENHSERRYLYHNKPLVSRMYLYPY